MFLSPSRFDVWGHSGTSRTSFVFPTIKHNSVEQDDERFLLSIHKLHVLADPPVFFGRASRRFRRPRNQPEKVVSVGATAASVGT